MRKHIDSSKALLVVFFAAGMSAACMSNPVAGTSEPDAGSNPTPPTPDAAPPPDTAPVTDTAVASPDSLPVKLDTAVAICGNGKLDPGESCDDGNLLDRDGCTASCTLEPGAVCAGPDLPCTFGPYCGDGIVQFHLGEQCDLGANNNGSYGGCNPDCTVGPYCGDGTVQTDHESCDDGNLVSADGCSSTCQCENSSCGNPGPVCGDGKLDAALGETCDDGNSLNDDGCSDTCQVEPCWAACGCDSSKPCLPVLICGNGKVEGSESCDDGNTMSGDGCSETCKIEPGWTCVAPGGRCSSVCGDGVLTAGEACDDGNARSGDGCSSTCQIEPNY